MTIVFDSNFTNNEKALRKATTKRNQPASTEAEKLENEAWLLCRRLGFPWLSAAMQTTVSYGRSAENLVGEKKIDVMTESDDARLYIECTTQSNLTTKIKSWIFDVTQIRKYESEKSIKKNIAYILYVSSDLGQADRNRLEQAGIGVLTSSDVEYYDGLARLYPRLAYYQLLGYLFEGKRSARYFDTELSVPAIRAKYTNDKYCYMFGVQPAKLIPLATVPHRKAVQGDKDRNQAYQRLVKPRKIKSIKEFLEKKRSVFPTNIILSIDPKGPGWFKAAGKPVGDIQHGTLDLPTTYRAITVIDGQHRLFAYDGLPSASKDLIYVIAFDRMSLPDQIQTFVDINVNQTSVSPSLMWDLMPLLDPSSRQAKAAMVAKWLNEEDVKGALYGVLEYDSAPFSNEGSKITLESFCTALIKRHVFALEREPLRKFLSDFFSAIRSLNEKHWARTDKRLNVLKSNQGIGALLMLSDDVFNYFGLNSTQERIQDLLVPLDAYIRGFEDDPLRVKEFKQGSSEQNKRRIYKEWAGKIKKVNDRFAPELEVETAKSELNEIIELFSQNGESDVLEAKECVFVNLGRSKQEQKLVENEAKEWDGLVKSLVAFANTNGGRYVIGVRNGDWDLVGIDETDLKLKKSSLDEYKRALSEKIIAYSEGLPRPLEIRTLRSEEKKTFVIVEIKRLSDASFQSQELAVLRSDNQIYYREDGMCVKLKPRDLKRYCDERLKAIAEEFKQE